MQGIITVSEYFPEYFSLLTTSVRLNWELASTEMHNLCEAMVMQLTQNTYLENTKSFDLLSPFLQLGLSNWSSA